MFKEVKYLYLFFIAIFITSCNSSTTTELKQDSILAEELLNKAHDAFMKCDYEKSTKYIDSIDSVYPKQIDVRRKVMPLRSQIKERVIIKEIQKQDSLLVECEIKKAPMEEVYKIQLCKEKLERQLQVARNQIARLQNDSIANE